MPTGVHFAHKVVIDGGDLAGITLAGATIDRGLRNPGEAPAPGNAYLTLISADAVPNIADRYPGFTWGDRIKSGFTVDWSDKYEGGLPRINVGARVAIDATTPTGFTEAWTDTYSAGFDATRFVGIITALDVLPGTINVTAVAAAEAFTRILIDPSGWPAETDLARVQRIASAAGISVLVDGTDSVPLAARAATESPANAWALLTEVAQSANAALYTLREGDVTYRTRGASGGSTVDLAPAATLLNDLAMSMELGVIANSVTVAYGPSNARAEVTVTDTASFGAYGRRDISVQTILADAAAATAYANRHLARYKDPHWRMPSATVNLRLAEAAGPFPGYLTELLGIDLDDSVHLPDLLPASPLPEYLSRVLGYRETLDTYSWSLTFSLNPAGWTNPDVT